MSRLQRGRALQRGHASDAAPSTGRTRRLIVAALGTLVGAAIVLAVGLVVLRPGTGPATGDTGAASGGSVAVGAATGQRAPDFRLVDVDGNTITRDSLRGRPAIVWFTASYCTPCQEGALALQRVLDRLSAADRVAVVMVFVDPGDPPAALADWKVRFGRPDWDVALAAGSVIRDYRVQYLDTKYLLDANGVIRTADYTPLQEGSWERDLRAVLGG